jgi:hypothetical protein
MDLRHWVRQWLLAIAVLLAMSGSGPELAQSDDLAVLQSLPQQELTAAALRR